MSDIKQALNHAYMHLAKASPSARLDAEILLAFVLNTTRTYLYTHPEQLLLTQQADKYLALLSQREEGQPIAYLTNTREFWSLPLKVNAHTLIPRPETELLVELTLRHLSAKTNPTVLDLGTGSGTIALALATEQPHWQILASDISSPALEIARENATHLNTQNVCFYQSDWFDSLPQKHFDAIISNPPYIRDDDAHLLEGDVRFEPKLALVSGVDGLNALRTIIEQSYHRLLPGGLLLVEHGYDQKEIVLQELRQHGFLNVQCWTDCQHNDRVSGGWHHEHEN